MIIKRFGDNPVLRPDINHSWEAQAVFNGCPVAKGKDIYMLYRALSMPHYHASARANMVTSDIGIASSKDGIRFNNRQRFIIPNYDWEKYGCEDPRVTKLGGKYYIFYTALSKYPFRADGIKVGVAVSKDLKSVSEKHLVTPFNAKAMALFPEKINGKMWAVLTVNTDNPPAEICLASFNNEKDIWSESYWNNWYKSLKKHVLPLRRSPRDHLEVGAPPVKTKYGWLLLYSYIRNYFSPNKLFGVEAVLLDLKDPSKIISRFDYPLLVPDEYYERTGLIPNVIFPTGAIIKGDWIYLYYGAADTTCCLAFINLKSLLKEITGDNGDRLFLKRAKKNPIIVPDKKSHWEDKAVFNPAAIYLNGKVHLVYRALSNDNVSRLGYATSSDGVSIDYQSPDPIYAPREKFEQKVQPGANSGCEDPRLTKIGNRIYMCYTAFDGKDSPRVAMSSISVNDFTKRKWNWAKPVLISPADLNDKDAFIFPEKVNGSYMIVHRVGYDIDYSFSNDLNFKADYCLEEYRWIPRREGWWDGRKVGAAAPPTKTKDGWVMIYHGLSDEGVYRVGAVLLDIKNPIRVIGRTTYPIFEPETAYEKTGQVPNVVFPCGTALIGRELFVYYGGGDSVVGVASVNIDKLLRILKSAPKFPREGF